MDATDTLELVGETVAEKYLIECVVGAGGFAIVYRATHKIWNRPVALKVFKALDEVPAEMRERLLKEFVQEGALLAELSEKSAAIVQARDIGMLTTKRGAVIPYMVLEWLEGRSLEAILADERAAGGGTRSLTEAMALLAPVAQALALAHHRGIAHRDVKPANIFVIGDVRAVAPTVKLLDFGIAKVVQDAQKMGGSFTKTSGQITSFTPAYGAPEQFSRDYGATGPWTDVFALALILVELLTGREPLYGDTLTQLAFASMDANRRPTPRTRGGEVSELVEQVCARALAVRQEDRFRSVGDFWAGLMAAADGEPWELATGSTMLASPSSARMPAAVRVTPAAGSRSNPPPAAAPAPKLAETQPEFPVPGSPPTAKKLPLALPVAAAVLVGVGVGAAFFMSRAQTGPKAGPSASASSPAVPSAVPSVAPATKCPAGMVLVPGGSFFMGTNKPKDETAAAAIPDHETPAHPVKLSAYCIDKNEVTVERYMDCARGKGCERADGDDARNDWAGISPADRKVYDPLCNMQKPVDHAKHPANCVSWEQATVYCRSTGGRLPTEAEWEFAARGLEQRRFPWGDDDNLAGRLNACGAECLAWGKKADPANFGSPPMYKVDDGFVHTAPVGQFKKGASAFGLEDMSGNVFEWVSDVFAPYPTRDKQAPTEAVSDPGGPAAEKDSRRVYRGGAWNSTQVTWLRPTFRFMAPPWYRTHGIGFRCAARPTAG